MNFKIHDLDGLQVIFAPLADANSTTIQVLVKAGSIYESRETNGLSHFLEHMFFKGGKKYPTPQAVAETLDSFGADYNAFTGNEYAGYYVKSAPEYIHKAIDVLADMLVHSQFPKPEIETEKGVVIQEIAMYEDNPQRLVWKKQHHWYYGDNSFGRPILGPAENVQSFTQENLLAHKQNLYTKDNLVIVVAGALPDQAKIEADIVTLFGPLPASKSGSDPVQPDGKPSDHTSSFTKETQQNHLVIAAPGFSHHDPDRYAAKILTKVLGGGMSSRLFQRIREQKGLCYYIGGTHSAGDTGGDFFVYAGMDKANRESGLEEIHTEIATIASGDITPEEFEKAMGNIRGSTKMGIETSDQMADFIGHQWLFKHEIKSLDDLLAEYEKVTLDQVNALGTKLVTDSLWTYWIQ